MNYTYVRRSLKFALLFAMLLSSTVASYLRAQSTANYSFTTSTTGSLGLDANSNVVDMSAGTTQLVAADQDNFGSAVTTIGFDFFLNGVRYTQFSASSNGVIQLGSAAVSGTNYLLSGGTAASPRIGAFAADLRTGISGKVHYKVVGTAPNRCLVVEFLNMSLTYVATPGSNDGTYQVRLYEQTGAIEYVYGTMYRNASTISSAAICVGFSVGSAANTLAAVTTSSQTVNYSSFSLNSYTLSAPIADLTSASEGSRRVYRFTPPVATAPGALSFTGVTFNSMTLNWTDNSADELGFAIYRSLDGVNYSYLTTTAANATSYVAAVTSSTMYYWRVYALTEGALSTPPLSGSQSSLAGSISGIKTVGTGGDYDNLTTAFAAINAQGLAGDADLQLITGYPATPETYPIVSSNESSVGPFSVKVYPMVSGLSITSANTTGTLNLNNAKNITFDGRVNQAGANDLVIANTNAGASYAVQFINDARGNTLKNLIIQSVNNSTTSGTIVLAGTTGANGNDNNTITACDIRDGATTPVNAIYSVGTTTTSSHFNDNVTISNNNISNFFSAGSATNGLFAGSGNSGWTISDNKFFQTVTRTYTSGNTHNAIQVSNSSGSGFTITGNTIGYASSAGTGTYTMAGTVATRFIGINVSVGTAAPSSVQNNTITGISISTSSGASSGNGILAGINITNGDVNVGTVAGNTIGSVLLTGAIVGTSSTSSALMVGINSSSAGTVTIANNAIGGFTVNGSSATISGSITGVQVSTGTPTITGNTIGSTTVANSMNSVTVATSGSQLVRGIDVSASGGAITIQSNTIANLNQNGTTTGAGVRGISYSGTSLATISQNTIFNLSGSTSNTSSNPAGIVGIAHTGSATGGASITQNVIYALSAMNTNSVQTNVSGISYSGPTAGTITRNRIYDLRNASTMITATTPPTAAGIVVRSVTTSVRVSNNMISLGNAQTSNTEFIGIWNNQTSSGAINVYHNSVSITGTAASGALPSYGVLRGDNSTTAITSTVDIRNNIFSNLRTGGTGKHYAVANQSGTPSTTGWGTNASNYNVLNTANATTTGLWGSADADFNAWRIASSGDANSFSAVTVNFVDVVAGDLHLNMGVTATPLESGGATIASVTTDFDNDTRPGPAGSVNGGGTAPDIGADEFDGVPALPVITLNSVTPPATTQCTSSSRLVSADITTPVGTIVSAYIGYTVNGVAQTPVTMTNTSGTTWEGTIPAPTPANAVIAWGVTATNSSALSGSYTGTTYADEPLLGTTSGVTVSNTTVCAGTSSDLTAKLTGAGTVQLGTSTSTTSTTGITPFSSNYEGSREQYLIRASELQALGLGAGNLTSLSFIVTASGTGAFAQSNFTIKMANTAQTALSSAYGTPSGSFVTVYTNASEPAPAVGTKTFTFSTPYNWDGTSNLLIDICHDNDPTSTCASCFSSNSTVRYTTTAFNSCWGSYADNAQSCGVQAASTISTYTNRPNMIFAGTVNQPITSVSWSDGATTVGTTNPLTVTPSVTTTYTATIVSAGCTVSPSPSAVVTVNPLPSTPTASSSTQCGVQVPTASVTSTSGAGAPEFRWYNAMTGGTVMQSGTSTTYTTSISATTTFYVCEVNTATGCESNRVAVTVTVAVPDPVSATASAATICLGQSVTLNAANTNATPVQSYSYSWLSATNSGAETTVNGSSVAITPLAAGSYVYSLTAVDGGCTATNTVSVNVNASPSAVTANASLATVCEGSSVDLTSSATANSTTTFSYTQGFETWPPAGWTFINNGSSSTSWAQATAPYTGTYGMSYHWDAANAADVWGITGGQTLVGGTNYTLTFWYRVESSSFPERLKVTVGNGATVAAQTTVLWNNNGGSQLTNTTWAQASISYTPAASGTYYFGFNCYSAADQYYLRVDDVALTGLESPVSYAWTSSPAGFTSSVQNPTGVVNNVSTTYTVSATNSLGCTTTASATVNVNALPLVDGGADQTVCAGDNVTLSGSGAVTYAWDNGVTDGVAFSAMTNGTYTVTGTDGNGCQNTDQVILTVNALPAVNAGADVFVCEGDNATLTASGTATGYSWDNGVTDGVAFAPVATQTYSVTGTDGNGCQNTDDVTVTVNALPVIDGGADQTVCEGEDVTLSGSGAASYTWDNGVTDGVSFAPSVSGTYTVTGTDGNGCQGTDDVTVTVNPVPAVIAGADETVCEGSSLTLAASGTATSYSWDNGVTDGVAFTPSASGTYTVTGTDANGCQSSDDLMVTVNPLPAVSAGADQTVCEGENVTLSGSGAVSYNWDNGVTDGVAFAATSTDTYTVTGTDANGCENTDDVTITVNVAPVATATDNGNGTFTASAGTSYQWIHCATGLPISGATSQTFTATINGSFAVVVSNASGCTDTSNCVTLTNVGVNELVQDATIRVFPNPTNADVFVTMSSSAATVTVVDAQGKVLQSTVVDNGGIIELSSYETGVYFLRITTEKGSAMERIVKH